MNILNVFVLLCFMFFQTQAVLTKNTIFQYLEDYESKKIIDSFSYKLSDENLLYKSEIDFDGDCMSVHTTHVNFFKGCNLPSKCVNRKMRVLKSKFDGYLDVYCYSIHKIPSNYQGYFYSIKFTNPINFKFDNNIMRSLGYSGSVLKNLIPSNNFFYHFLILKNNETNPRYSIIPKIMNDNFWLKNNDHSYSLTFDNYCISHITHPQYKPLTKDGEWFTSVTDALMNFNFPLEFDTNKNKILESNKSSLNFSKIDTDISFNFPFIIGMDGIYYTNTTDFSDLKIKNIINRNYKKKSFCFQRKNIFS